VEAAPPRREFLISKAWIQAVVLVVLCGFFVLGLLAHRTYMAHPPVPVRVVDARGNVLFTGDDISQGGAARWLLRDLRRHPANFAGLPVGGRL
jgi:nitric oxide reductase large subunit